MAVISSSRLPGGKRERSGGGQWGQLGARDAGFVNPYRGVIGIVPHPRAQIHRDPLPVAVERAPPARFSDGRLETSLPRQIELRQQVLDIIRIDQAQKTPTNYAQFLATPYNKHSRPGPLPLHIYLPEPDQPYPIPFQPVCVGRARPENGLRAGQSNPGAGRQGGTLVGGAFRRYKRKRSMGCGGSRRPRRDAAGRFLPKAKRTGGRGRKRAREPEDTRPRSRSRSTKRARAQRVYQRTRPREQYRMPYDMADRPERAGERAWEVNSIPMIQPPRPSNLPPAPPAYQEQPLVSRAPPPVVEYGAYVPRPLYGPPAVAYDENWRMWNQPVGYLKPANVAYQRPDLRFDAARHINQQPVFGAQGSGWYGRGGTGPNWNDKMERQYQHIKHSYLRQGTSLADAERIAASTVNAHRS